MKVTVELHENRIAIRILEGYHSGNFIHNGTDIQYFNSAEEAIKWATDIGYEVIQSPKSDTISAIAEAAGLEVVDVKMTEVEDGGLSGLPVFPSSVSHMFPKEVTDMIKSVYNESENDDGVYQKSSHPKGLTVKELKAILADWPETDENGYDTKVYISIDGDTDSTVHSVWPTTVRLNDNDKPVYHLGLDATDD